MDRQHAMALWDAEVRMTEVHCLAGAQVNGFSDDEFLEDLKFGLDFLHDSMKVFSDFPVAGNEEDALEWFTDRELYGFIVKAETPVPQKLSGTAYAFSWGLYRSQYFYVEVIEDAVDLAVKWSKEVVEGERKKAAIQ